jgi:two-component system, NarL family, invasion response regulator UvrY
VTAPGEIVSAHGSKREEQTSGERGAKSSDVTVLTVDDQAVFRDLARLVLQATPGFQSVGAVASGERALEVLEALQPQLVLVDVRMPGIGGIETARRISAARPEAVVVLISVEEPVDLPSGALESGAAALVRKQDFGAALLRELWAQYGAR